MEVLSASAHLFQHSGQANHRLIDQEIHRASTVFQLMAILEDARYSLIVIEHDPLNYEDAQGIVEYIFQGLHDAAKEAAVGPLSPS